MHAGTNNSKCGLSSQGLELPQASRPQFRAVLVSQEDIHRPILLPHGMRFLCGPLTTVACKSAVALLATGSLLPLLLSPPVVNYNAATWLVGVQEPLSATWCLWLRLRRSRA